MNNIKKKYNLRIIKNYTSYENNNNTSYKNNNNNLPNNNLYIYNLKSNSSIVHPLSLQYITANNNDLCLTKYNYKNNNINSINNYKCNYNLNKYKEYIYIPPIGLSTNDILNIYNISSLDALYLWIEDNYEDNNMLTIDRIIYCWITTNITMLLSHKKYLLKIMILIVNKYNLIHNINSKIDKNINKDIEDYLNNFISNIKKYNNINFKLSYMLYDYLYNKYKS